MDSSKEPVQEAFKRVKQDIDSLKKDVDSVKQTLIELCEIIEKLAKKSEESRKNQEYETKNQQNNENQTKIQYIPQYIPIPAHMLENQTNQQINPAHNFPFNPLNPQNMPFSTGNRGVPADRQTHQQTDNYTDKPAENTHQNTQNTQNNQNSIENAAKMIESLDNLKNEIKQKFKKLTEQEWLVFSTIYQFDNEVGHSDYRSLAERLKLTESSIRDYVARLIKKGIPVDKTKINNKEIQLNISSNLKHIASLSAILTLRDI
ncbi:MAG: hypothetical protein WD876_00285 [Candidatus Pacearchaeota archaeon]